MIKKDVDVKENDFVGEVKHKAHIEPMLVDFSREDLNLMGAKVNEIIAYLNK